jgi:hypothetical protein
VGGNQPTFSIIIAELSSERCEEEEAHTLQRASGATRRRLYSPLRFTFIGSYIKKTSNKKDQ